MTKAESHGFDLIWFNVFACLAMSALTLASNCLLHEV